MLIVSFNKRRFLSKFNFKESSHNKLYILFLRYARNKKHFYTFFNQVIIVFYSSFFFFAFYLQSNDQYRYKFHYYRSWSDD